MKRVIALLLTAVMVFGMVACSSSPNTDTATQSETTTAAQGAAETTGETSGETTAQQPAANVDTSIIPATVKLTDTTALQGKKIGCSICYKGDEWCYALSVALETLGSVYGCDIVVEDGDLNDETQTKQIENMIAAGCDMIMIDPITYDGSNEALMKAVDAKIPIIIYDGAWSNGEQYAVTTVTWDQPMTGEMIGNYLIDYVKKNMDGKAKLVEVIHSTSTHCQERMDRFNELIDAANAEGCDISVVNTVDCNGNRELAYNGISAIVEPYDFVVSVVDNGAMGACSALQAAGNTDVKVLSMGAYGEEPFTALHNGDPNYMACLNVDPWILAQFIYEGAINYYEGEEVDKLTNIDLYVVDASNVTDFWSFD